MSRRFQCILPLFAAFLALSLWAAAPGHAQDEPQPTTIEDTPAQAANATGKTTVAVVHGDVDQLGTRLAFLLKERFGASPLFDLSAKDEKKIKVILTTAPEFPGRPQLGSVYAAVWIYSASDAVLTHYLASEAGTIDAATVEATAEALAARTAAAAEQYAYLFE